VLCIFAQIKDTFDYRSSTLTKIGEHPDTVVRVRVSLPLLRYILLSMHFIDWEHTKPD